MLAHVGFSSHDHGPDVLSGPVVSAVDPMWSGTTTPYGPLPVLWPWPAPLPATLRLPRLASGVLLTGFTVVGLVAPLDSSLHGRHLVLALAALAAAPLMARVRASGRVGRGRRSGHAGGSDDAADLAQGEPTT